MNSGWRDISTAPRDGTELIVFGRDRYVMMHGHVGGDITAVATYQEDADGFHYDWRILGADKHEVWVLATHWQPKPEGPA